MSAEMLHQDRGRAESFGAEAELYDRVRPSYPTELVDDLLAEAPERMLDVACGSGIAARLFAGRVKSLEAVEPDERMAAVARSHGIDVDVSTFEDWAPPAQPFDLVTCGHAWHWIDPAAGPLKVAEVLRSGGRFAAFWNFYRHEPEVLDAFSEVYERLAPQIASGSVVLGHDGETLAHVQDEGFRAAGCFHEVEHRSYWWERRCTKDGWLSELVTHSDHRKLPSDRLAVILGEIGSAIEALGGAILIRHETFLLTAVRD